MINHILPCLRAYAVLYLFERDYVVPGDATSRLQWPEEDVCWKLFKRLANRIAEAVGVPADDRFVYKDDTGVCLYIREDCKRQFIHRDQATDGDTHIVHGDATGNVYVSNKDICN